MTKTVGKGAGRASHAAKTAKHAQRNPVSKATTAAIISEHVQSAPDSEAAMAAALDGTQYGRMSVVELRALVKGMKGAPAVSRMKKGDLLNWLLDAQCRASNEAEIAAAQAEQDQLAQDADSPGGAYEPEPAASEEQEYAGAVNPKGAAKAAKLAEALAPHGWTTEVVGDSAKVTAVARRGGETITVVWLDGVYQYDESVHVVHDRTTRLRNVSAGIKLGARPSAVVEAEYGRVIANRRFRPANTKASEGHVEAAGEGYAVPADKRLWLENPNEVTYDELWSALAGYRVVWVNRVSNTTESATVSQNARFFNVRHNPKGELMVEFCTVGMGFRACRVADIISTSRALGKARRTKTQPGGVEVRAA